MGRDRERERDRSRSREGDGWAAGEKDSPGHSLYINGINYETSAGELRDLFGRYGSVRLFSIAFYIVFFYQF